MQTKSVLYAAVGAPVVAARRVGDKVTDMKDRVGEKTSSRSKAAGEAIEGWAVEGEKVVTRVSEGKVVEEISSKVDLDQAKEQVGKLRDQLEDMLATWRTSFRPEKTDEDTEPTETEKSAKEAPAKEAPAKEAKKPVAKKQPAAKAATAKKPATRTSAGASAAKTSSAKTEKAS